MKCPSPQEGVPDPCDETRKEQSRPVDTCSSAMFLSCYLLQVKGEVMCGDTKNVFKRHVILKRNRVPLGGVIHPTLQILFWNDL